MALWLEVEDSSKPLEVSHSHVSAGMSTNSSFDVETRKERRWGEGTEKRINGIIIKRSGVRENQDIYIYIYGNIIQVVFNGKID